MLFWTLQTTIISIILIFLVHHLILFFKNTLTVPKIKDMVHAPSQKYENIYNTISSKDYTNSLLPTIHTELDTHVVPDAKSMKEELKLFLKSKANNEPSMSIGATNISMLDSFSSPNFASY
jgi:hypothetical protein